MLRTVSGSYLNRSLLCSARAIMIITLLRISATSLAWRLCVQQVSRHGHRAGAWPDAKMSCTLGPSVAVPCQRILMLTSKEDLDPIFSKCSYELLLGGFQIGQCSPASSGPSPGTDHASWWHIVLRSLQRSDQCPQEL